MPSSEQKLGNRVKSLPPAVDRRFLRSSRQRSRVLLIAAAAAVTSLLRPVRANSYTWDPGQSNGNAPGGTNSWDASSLFWYNGSSDVAWGNATSSDAYFAGTAGIVTLAAPITAHSLFFSTTGYTITDGGNGTNTLTLGGTTPTITVNDGLSDTISATLTGTAGMVKAGNGTLLLSGTNSYSGNTSIAAGVLQLGNGLALRNSTVAMTGGNLAFAQNIGNFTLGGLSGSGNISLVDTNSAAVNLFVGNNGGSNTYSGAFSGNGSVVQIGTGTTTLTGNSTFTGGLTIKAGTVGFNTLYALGSGNITLGDAANTGAAATLSGAGAGTSSTGFGGNITNPITSTGNGTNTIVVTSWNPIFSGPVTLNNNLVLSSNNNSGSTLTFTGNFTGTGNLTLANNSNSNNPSQITLSTGTVNMVGSITNSGNGNGSGIASTISGNIGGNVTGVIENSATSPLILSGSNSFTGALTISAGTVQLGAGGTTGSLAPASTITDNGTLIFDRTNALTTQGTDFSAAPITGSGNLTQLGNGTVVLNASNTFSGTTTITAGALTFQGNNALPSLTAISLGSATLNIKNDGSGNNGTISLGNSITINTASTADTINVGNNTTANTANTVAFGALSNGTAAQANNITINFTGANGYLQSFSSLALTGGTGGSTTLNPTSTSITITGNVTNQETGNVTGHYDALTLGGNTAGNFINGNITDSSGYVSVSNGDTRVTMSGTGAWTLAGASSYHGPTSITSGTLNLTGSLSNTQSVSTSSTGNFAESAAGSIGGNATFTQGSSGASTLSGANNYSGTTTLNTGTLQLANALAVQNSTLTANSGGNLAFAQNIGNFTLGGLSGSGNITLVDTNAAAVNLVVGYSNAVTTYSGTLSGNGSITAIGNGTLTLSGSNSFTGGLTINAGTVVLSNGGNNSVGNGTITIGNSANTGLPATLVTNNGNHNSPYTETFSNQINVTGNGADTIEATNYNPIYTGGISLSDDLSIVSNNTGGSTITLTGNFTGTGNLTLANNSNTTSASQISLTTGTVNMVGNITNSGNGSGSGIASTISGNIGANVTGVIENSGNSSLTLSGSNSYPGLTIVSKGTLFLSTTGTNNISSSSAIVVASGATFNVAGVTGTGGFALSNTAGAGGNLSQVLGGAGTVTGNLTVGPGSKISAGTSTALGTGSGNSTGTLTTGNQTWKGGGAYVWKITAPGTAQANNTTLSGATNDLLDINSTSTSGTLAINTASLGAFTITPQGTLTLPQNGIYNWVIAQIGNGTGTHISVNGGNMTASSSTPLVSSGSWSNSGLFALDTSGLTINGGADSVDPGNFSLYFETISSNNDLVLDYNATPEPGTALLLLTGTVPLLMGRRRRKKE